ncbi:8871_t:CDS:2, partial [Cetraspora pellucida]
YISLKILSLETNDMLTELSDNHRNVQQPVIISEETKREQQMRLRREADRQMLRQSRRETLAHATISECSSSGSSVTVSSNVPKALDEVHSDNDDEEISTKYITAMNYFAYRLHL